MSFILRLMLFTLLVDALLVERVGKPVMSIRAGLKNVFMYRAIVVEVTGL